MSTKLQRNIMGGTAAGLGALVLNHVGVGELGLLGWFIYCSLSAIGANIAHGKANVAAIEKGLEKAK